MIIVPLGVASATPTATRHLPSIALWREGSISLFDCGENTQMRMLQAGMKRSRVDHVFLSHFDVDHYTGLIGLLSTLQLQRRERELIIVAPEGIRSYVEWNMSFGEVDVQYPIRYIEIEKDFEGGTVLDEEEYFVEARPLKHNRFCLGYRFQEKDKPGKVDAEKAMKMGIDQDWQYKELKAGNDVTLDDGSVVPAAEIVGHPRPGDSFAYITDSTYSPNSVKLAMNTNILVHEATFSATLAEKATETGHSTSLDAARVANESQTKLLVITHFSARYTNPFVLLREARQEFFPAWLATELRPIFTDPAHEKGIIEPRVFIKELSDRKGTNQRGRDSRSGRATNRPSAAQGRKRRAKISNNSSERDKSRTGRRRRSESSSSGERRPRRRQVERREPTRQPRPITPRTPFDDFDRF
ncbi:MAG: ribonuclease Z [Balneolaceae bacterium]